MTRDFTLPNNESNRQVAIKAYQYELSETMILLEEVNDLSDADVAERVIVAARDANRIAFELRINGELSEEKYQRKAQACRPHLPKRPYMCSHKQ